MPLPFLSALTYIVEVVIHFLWGWVCDLPPTVQTVHWGFKSSVRHCRGSYFQTAPSQEGGRPAPPAFFQTPMTQRTIPTGFLSLRPRLLSLCHSSWFWNSFPCLTRPESWPWVVYLFVCLFVSKLFDKSLDHLIHIIAILTTWHISLTLNFRSSIY